MRRPLTALALSAALVVLASPAGAAASTITPTKACYSRVPVKGSEPLTFRISGGVPGGRYLVSANGGRSGSVEGVFDAAGNSTNAITDFSTNGSIGPIKAYRYALSVQEYGGSFAGAVTGTATTSVTNLAMEISNARLGRPFAKRTWVMSGLTPLFGKGALYASWVKRGGKRVVKSARLGTPNACGYLRIKRNASPARRNGRWKIYVHVGKKLSTTKSTIWNWQVFGL